MYVGTKTDDEIWNDTAAAHPFMHWERWLGDAAYSTCLGVLTRRMQDPHSILWQDEAYVNDTSTFTASMWSTQHAPDQRPWNVEPQGE
jgi:hypothetical protein